jgi:peptidoglycan/xylan/chitin deacetylase (PgdA/CDA1 family)
MIKYKIAYDQDVGGPYARRGLVVRLFYMFVSLVLWTLSGFGLFLARRVIILCYHGIAADQAKRFEDQIMRLRGWTNPNVEAKNRPAIGITFDDAFCNLLDNALPLLNELRIPAIVFAVPGNLGQFPKWNIAADHPDCKEKTMTAQQLKSIQNELIAIGSHTQTHPDLSKLSPEQVRWELTESKKNLERLLDKPIEYLALPHGACSQEVLRLAEEIGYKRVYTLEPKLIRTNHETGAIGRFSMSPNVWPIEFYLTCVGAYQWLGPWRRMVRSLRKLLS